MPYIIAEPCINLKDRSCVDVCPVDCIYEGEDQLYIHPDECIDCGACEPECPVTAIFPEEDTPPQWKSYIAKNRDVFQSASPPGKPQRKGSLPTPRGPHPGVLTSGKPSQEVSQQPAGREGLFEGRDVPGGGDDVILRIGDELRHGARRIGGRNLVLASHQHERRHPHPPVAPPVSARRAPASPRPSLAGAWYRRGSAPSPAPDAGATARR